MEATFINFMYVTFPNMADAQRICKPLVENKLAACVNIIPSCQSISLWNNQLVEQQEVLALIKTRSDNISRIEEIIKAEHPYDVPCIVAIDVTGGDQVFLDWVRTNTR